MNRRHAGALALVGWYFASAAAGEPETSLAHWESYRPPTGQRLNVLRRVRMRFGVGLSSKALVMLGVGITDIVSM